MADTTNNNNGPSTAAPDPHAEWHQLLRKGDEEVKKGPDNKLEKLLNEQHIDVNKRFGDVDRTPACEASFYNQFETVKWLKSKGADVNIGCKYDVRPLHWAAQNGNLAMAKWLVEDCKVEEDSNNRFGRTPLLWGAVYGQTEVVKYLGDRGNKLDHGDLSKNTALHRAAYNGRVGTTEYLLQALLQKGLDTSPRNMSEKTPLDLARDMKQTKVIEILEKWEKDHPKH